MAEFAYAVDVMTWLDATFVHGCIKPTALRRLLGLAAAAADNGG
jgi:hypothetical protein